MGREEALAKLKAGSFLSLLCAVMNSIMLEHLRILVFA